MYRAAAATILDHNTPVVYLVRQSWPHARDDANLRGRHLLVLRYNGGLTPTEKTVQNRVGIGVTEEDKVLAVSRSRYVDA